MNTEKQPKTQRRIPGARYETCRECGMEWNVSRLAPIPPGRYLCPVCWTRQRRENAEIITRK